MQFYTRQHKFYCGIDLHARKMFVCILDAGGNIRIHQNINTEPGPLWASSLRSGRTLWLLWSVCSPGTGSLICLLGCLSIN